MVDEDKSHSTDLSVSGEKGHSAILLALQLRTKLFSNAGYTAKLCTKMLRNLIFVVHFAYFSTRPKNFLFFEQRLSKFRYRM